MRLSQRLATYRKENGLSLMAIGDRIGTSYEYVRMLELDRAVPDARVLRELAYILGLSALEVGTVVMDGPWLEIVRDERERRRNAPATGTKKIRRDLDHARQLIAKLDAEIAEIEQERSA